MPVRVDDPIDLLLEEHVKALAVLDRLETVLRNPTTPGALAAAREGVTFLEEEVRAHNEREEESLFPALDRHLPPFGPTGVMRMEHRKFWQLLADFKAALMGISLESGAAYNTGLAAIDLLRRHIHKENEILFPMAQKLLSADEMAAVARRMEELIEDRGRDFAPAPRPG